VLEMVKGFTNLCSLIKLVRQSFLLCINRTIQNFFPNFLVKSFFNKTIFWEKSVINFFLMRTTHVVKKTASAYLGHFKHSDSYRLKQKILEDYPFTKKYF
jgi:hypothetical protein